MTATTLPRFTIGGSQAAAAAGVHPSHSRVALWLELTGRIDRPASEAMAWRARLVPLIADALTDTGREIVPAPAEGFTDPARPWCVGHCARLTKASDGSAAVLVVTTAGVHAWPADGGVPVHYQARALHYMHLTGTHRCIVACLVGGQRLAVAELERDDAALSLLLALEEDFYQHLRTDKLPAPDGSDSTRAALLAYFPGAEPCRTVRLTGAAWQALLELRARREQRAQVDAQIAALENTLKAEIGDAERAYSPHDTEVLRWTNVHSRRLDTSALKAARPDVYQEFVAATPTRRFQVL